MEKKVILSQPLIINGKEVSELTVRPTTVGDEEDAMQEALSIKRGRNPLAVEMSLFAKSCKIPYDALRGLKSGDYVKIRRAFNEVNGFEAAEDENPMTRLTG